MPHWEGKRPITIVTACMRSDGLPDFALTEVEVTQEEFENGVHYVLAEERLDDRGYEEPYVHFDEHEGPSFLHRAVREYLTCKPTEPQLQEAR
jgi:hypothetical protein